MYGATLTKDASKVDHLQISSDFPMWNLSFIKAKLDEEVDTFTNILSIVSYILVPNYNNHSYYKLFSSQDSPPFSMEAYMCLSKWLSSFGLHLLEKF